MIPGTSHTYRYFVEKRLLDGIYIVVQKHRKASLQFAMLASKKMYLLAKQHKVLVHIINMKVCLASLAWVADICIVRLAKAFST